MTHARRLQNSRARAVSRRGFTLVESLVVILLTTTVLGGMATLLHGVWRTDRTMSDHRTQQSVLFRLTELFRADANACTLDSSMPTSGEAAVDQIALARPDGQTVHYRTEAGEVERLVKLDGAVQHRDTFTLPSNATATWQLPAADARLLTMQIVRRAPDALSVRPGESGDRSWRVEALLNVPPAKAAGEEPTE